MGELINGRTPEEIKQALKHCNEPVPTACTGCPYNGTCLEHAPEIDALALIERLEAERDAALAKVPKWISVEDRLPDTDDWVAVWYRDKDGDYYFTAGSYQELSNGQKYWMTDVDDNARAYPPEKITHWMPLPEPPKEE